jgi:WD40 repeat protein
MARHQAYARSSKSMAAANLLDESWKDINPAELRIFLGKRVGGGPGQKLQETLEGHEAEIYAIAFSPDGKTLASVSQDQTLRLWPIRKRAPGAK